MVCHNKLIIVLQEIETTESIKNSCELYKAEFSDRDLMEYLVKITSRTTRFTAVDVEEEWGKATRFPPLQVMSDCYQLNL
jgi:hypothetical protein